MCTALVDPPLTGLSVRGIPRGLGGLRAQPDVGPFKPMIDSWALHLRAEKGTAKTIRTYPEAAQQPAGSPCRLAAGRGRDSPGTQLDSVAVQAAGLADRLEECSVPLRIGPQGRALSSWRPVRSGAIADPG